MSGFHSDKVLQQMIKNIFSNINITSFVETGTHTAGTSKYIATLYPNISIFTCEINDKFYNISLNQLRNCNNVQLFKQSSEKFIYYLINNNLLGEIPLFFLDAHWYDYWPLKDEVANISKLNKFIILIDDFQVPNQPQFGSDCGGGGILGVDKFSVDNRPCNIDLIKEYINDCIIFYPNYTQNEAKADHLRGYVFILKNIDKLSIFENNTMFFKF